MKIAEYSLMCVCLLQSFISHPETGNMDTELSEDVFKPRRNLLEGKQPVC